MRKLIDIDPEILKDLKVLAAKADKPVKHYIESVITEHVKKATSRKAAKG